MSASGDPEHHLPPSPASKRARRAAPRRRLRTLSRKSQAAAPAERERLLLIERAGRELAEALGRVALAMNATLDLPELLNLICRESASLFQVQTAFVWLVEGAELFGFAAYGEGRERWLGRRVPLADPITLGPRVIREKRPIFVNDIPAAIRTNEVNADLVRQFHIQSILGMPLLKGERAVGALILIDTQRAGRFDHTHVATARLFASHAATAVDNARLFDETRKRLADLEAVNRISVVLRSAQTLDTMLAQLMEITLTVVQTDTGAILLYDPEAKRLRWSVAHGWCARLAPIPIKPGDGIAGRVFETGRTHVAADVATDPVTHDLLRAQMPAGWGGAGIAIHTADEIVGVLFVFVPAPRELTPHEIGLLTTIAEMAGNAIHRMQLFAQTEARLKRLDALRTIDKAISASLDLGLTLDVLLAQIASQLGVDGADVLLLNPASQTLEYTAGLGFRTEALRQTRLRLGEGYAGRAAAERRIVHVADLRARKTDFLRSAKFADEQFVSYYGVPLIAKGDVRGVLEVYQRQALAASPEWLGFLETLAGQAAIAIDNAVLFENLQRSNNEIALAYDATIEGWSRALELRDQATEGHTRRVTEMTLLLARSLGMDDSALVHVRRGALLHDIGKMGIPDSILRKPGPLNDDEWQIMRRHPGYAYEMLSSIAYLRPALDIPYCHHERWDGSGYPRNLKGEAIPLSARIFAVVDVWDALSSERPYRAAWLEEKVFADMLAQSGRHFDPQAVQAFTNLMRERRSAP
ncbi:MAG: GAF domain-containing protein [Anaerolineales bacterium]